MGQSHPKYRITSTTKRDTTKNWQYWEGMCSEVTLGKKLAFPNGEEYPYIRFNKGVRITEGPHKGFYELEKV